MALDVMEWPETLCLVITSYQRNLWKRQKRLIGHFPLI